MGEDHIYTPELDYERFSILSAWRMPKGCRDLVPDSLGVVNHFRIVFSCLTGKKMEHTQGRFFRGWRMEDYREVPYENPDPS
mgnify:CR=1 FL=1